MARTTSRVEGVLACFLVPILPNIGIEPAIETLIKIHRCISVNVAYVASNLGGGHQVHLALIVIAEEFKAQVR